MLKDEVQTLLESAPHVLELLRSAKSDSLVEYTRTTRVEPITLIEKKAVHLPYMHDIMQSLNSIFSGYYLQAVALSVNVGRINTLKLLDKLNPNRNVGDNVLSRSADYISENRHMLSMEAYTHRLPRIGDDKEGCYQDYALEGISLEARKEIISSSGFGRDAVKLSQETANLSVGKLIEVTIEDCGSEATIPVAVRLIANAIDSESLIHTLSVGSKNKKSVKERWHSYRAGQIEFIRDLVLCQDLIADHRKNLVRDKSGTYERTMKRRKGNKLSAILSGNPSVATASSMVVITQDTAKALERELGGRLSQFKTRENMFKETYTMILCVVNTDWEQVTMYHRSIDSATELSVKELKSSNKGSGPDVAEILKAYQLGNSPSI